MAGSVSDKPEQLVQCRMRRIDFPFYTTGWIPAHAAKVGKKVEVLPEGNFWEVVEAYADTSQPSDYLHEREKVRRKGLPSIRDTKKDKKRDKPN